MFLQMPSQRWGALVRLLWGCKKPPKGHPENISFNMYLQDGVPFSSFFLWGCKKPQKGPSKTCLSTCGFKMGCPFQLSLGMLQTPKRAPQKHVFQHVASRWGALFSFLWEFKKLQQGRPKNMSFNMWLRDGVPFAASFGDAPSPQKDTSKTCLSTCGFEMGRPFQLSLGM